MRVASMRSMRAYPIPPGPFDGPIEPVEAAERALPARKPDQVDALTLQEMRERLERRGEAIRERLAWIETSRRELRERMDRLREGPEPVASAPAPAMGARAGQSGADVPPPPPAPPPPPPGGLLQMLVAQVERLLEMVNTDMGSGDGDPAFSPEPSAEASALAGRG